MCDSTRHNMVMINQYMIHLVKLPIQVMSLNVDLLGMVSNVEELVPLLMATRSIHIWHGQNNQDLHNLHRNPTAHKLRYVIHQSRTSRNRNRPGNSILIGDSLLHSTGIDIGSNTGIGVTIRKHGDATFTGIVTAKEFRTTGNITANKFWRYIKCNWSSIWIRNKLSQTQTDVLNKVYYTDSVLRITSNTIVDTPPAAWCVYKLRRNKGR